MGSDSLVPGIWRVGICCWANKRAGPRLESPSADTDARNVRRVVVFVMGLLSLFVGQATQIAEIIVGARRTIDTRSGSS